MIAIVLELLISWVLLRFILHQDLSVLGMIPRHRKTTVLVIVGFCLPLIYLSLLYAGIAVWVQNPFYFNPDCNLQQFLKCTAFVFKGVVTEELLFRGAGLYILLKKTRPKKAALISAAGFGIYHWFSYQVFGQPLPMITVLLSTGIMGYLFAFALIKSESLLLPLALHLGYNFTSMIIFSKEKNLGNQLLIPRFAKDPLQPEGLLPLLMVIIYYAGFPILCYVFLRLIQSPAANSSRAKKKADQNDQPL